MGKLGVTPPNWLGDPKYALLTIILLELWRGIGFYVVTYVAALLAIPEELYDAAQVDGATGLTRFFRITLPLIRPTLLFTRSWPPSGIQLSIRSMAHAGSPANHLRRCLFIYDNAFRYERIGRLLQGRFC